METINLQMLGMTKDELQERVVNCISDRMLNEIYTDEDGEEVMTTSTLVRLFQKKTKENIDKAVSELAERYVLPNVTEYIENLCLQRTNAWGEAQGEKFTFVEYLIKQAHEYMLEKVNYEGKAKSEKSFGSWSGTQTRVAHLIHQHLHYSIENAMKKAVATANSSIVEGLEETVKIKLNEISEKLKVTAIIK